VLSEDGHPERTRVLDPGDGLIVDGECICGRVDLRTQHGIAAAGKRDDLSQHLAGAHVEPPVEYFGTSADDRQVHGLGGGGIIRDFEIRLSRMVAREGRPYIECGNSDIGRRLEY
jgi:hypothetical protein